MLVTDKPGSSAAIPSSASAETIGPSSVAATVCGAIDVGSTTATGWTGVGAAGTVPTGGVTRAISVSEAKASVTSLN